ncbi:MAG: hypothetical protein JW881_03500 [Spirochaetales bacterium]|nr:hypothetical protein [Spirochaetales bacterium]
MQLKLKHLLETPYLDELQISIETTNIERSHAFSLKNGQVIKQKLLTTSYIRELISRQINTITIHPDANQFSRIIQHLRASYPDQYPKPTNTFTIDELEALLTQYEEMNKYSEKKRYLILLQEITRPISADGRKRDVVVPYKAALNPAYILKMRKYETGNACYECFDTEQGILIITISRDEQDTLHTIMAAADLVARLEKYFKLDLAYSIPEAFEKFKANQPKLVVFGNYKYKNKNGDEVINAKARYSYLEIRNFDIYLKCLFIDQVNLQENREKLAQEILTAYKQPYTITISDSKVPLQEPDKKKYLNLLEKLNRQFSMEEYLKLSIQLKSIENTYQVAFLKNQLKNIHKLHSVTYK